MSAKMSALPAADPLTGAETMHVVVGGVNKRTTAGAIAGLAVGDAATAELIRDTIAVALAAIGVSITVDDAANTITLAAKRTCSFFFTTSPSASEELVIWTPANGETVTFADEFVGASGKAIDPPDAAPYVLIVKKNGAQVGTISIATTGVITFATTGAAVSFIGGTDYLTVEAPAVADATCSRATITLIGTVG